MKRTRSIIVLFFVALAALWSMPPDMRAQTSNQAALVVRHGDNDVRTACVEFEEDQISGYDLLQRSGAQLQLDVQGIGALVCSIDSTGCPPNDCLCHCKGGGDCIYWSYWHQLNGSWEYSQGGSSVYAIEHGAVEGWSWGPGAVNQAYPPPNLTFEDVCQPEPTNTPTASPTATATMPPLLFTPAATAEQEPSQAATATPPPSTATNTATPQPTATLANTSTPQPGHQQSTVTAVPTNTSLPAQPTSTMVTPNEPPPVAVSIENTPQALVDGAVDTLEEEAREAVSPVDIATKVTPVAVAAAQRIAPDRSETTSSPGTQKIAAPSAEPTAPLQVIGEGVVPAASENEEDPATTAGDVGSFLDSDIFSYLVFVLIVSGLASFLGLVSLRKRHRS